ncbi:MAG TPA: glycosyltransferase, partial [Dehalococcoidia bacterium]|nr:glycosyltransferase [Dehalococcoidia bacterium]
FLPDFVSELVPFHHENGLRYDLVHSHYWLSGVVGEKLKAVWGVPHVTTFHTLARLKEEALGTVVESPLRSTIEAGVISAADMIITFTEDEKERITRLYGAQAERIRVVPCGVNTQLFRPMNRDEARKALGLSPEDKDILLFVGRMEPLKGLDLLLHMVRCLGHREGLRLLIVGGDWQSTEEIARLRRLAFELGIYERVTLWGAVEQERLPLFYAAASVCIVPSYYESFGLVAMEALASGTPVVASCTGGVRDILENGWNGYLIPSRDPWLFARYVESILDHAELGQRMGQAGRASAQQYSWSQVAEGVLSGYQEVLQGFRS